MSGRFDRAALDLDCGREAERLARFIRDQAAAMKRERIVVGLSGGVDSAVSASLSALAMGPARVLALLLPERESQPSSETLAREEAARLGLRTERVDLTAALESLGAYRVRDAGVRAVFPDYEGTGRVRMVLPPDLLGRDAFNIFSLEVEGRDGARRSRRVTPEALRTIVAATNLKQRTRMLALYHAAERDNALVCGTTNRTEALQGFFVKYGDGGVDVEPIAHLFKRQVFQLARFLGVTPEIVARPPSPDTYGIPVSDEEFFFRIPYDTLDLLLHAWETGVPAADAAAALGLAEAQVARAFRDFRGKHEASRHMRAMPPTPAPAMEPS